MGRRVSSLLPDNGAENAAQRPDVEVPVRDLSIRRPLCEGGGGDGGQPPHADHAGADSGASAMGCRCSGSCCSPRVLVIRRATTAAATRKTLLASSAR